MNDSERNELMRRYKSPIPEHMRQAALFVDGEFSGYFHSMAAAWYQARDYEKQGRTTKCVSRNID